MGPPATAIPTAGAMEVASWTGSTTASISSRITSSAGVWALSVGTCPAPCPAESPSGAFGAVFGSVTPAPARGAAPTHLSPGGHVRRRHLGCLRHLRELPVPGRGRGRHGCAGFGHARCHLGLDRGAAPAGGALPSRSPGRRGRLGAQWRPGGWTARGGQWRPGGTAPRAGAGVTEPNTAPKAPEGDSAGQGAGQVPTESAQTPALDVILEEIDTVVEPVHEAVSY